MGPVDPRRATSDVPFAQLHAEAPTQIHPAHSASCRDDSPPTTEQLVNALTKVQPHHLKRDAYLYIRQSSMRQVLENTESTKRQYALRGRATALGWTDDHIVVIDSDQGVSGSSAAWREGFQRLVAEVGIGKAGIVMGLEVSRLARNNADWHRLLEICALSDTLILDEDGVYDPSNFNDRLLLGLKGTMSEAELHVLKARLRGGIITKARRGEFRVRLPVGLVYGPTDNVMLDPDAQVRETIQHFFETFSRIGSLHGTVKAFRAESILFPARHRVRGAPSKLLFQPLTSSAANHLLHNPRYAGVYAFGRRRYRRTAAGTHSVENLAPEDWTACIPDAHPGYLTWEQHKENLQILLRNSAGYDRTRRPPREGKALLQGRGVCGVCGRRMRAKYYDRRGGTEVWYVCWRATADRGDPACQSVAGPLVDKAVGALIGDVVTPAAIELALEVRRELESRVDEADRIRAMAVQRAEQDVSLARRRFMAVDPSNRLVADSLEGDWNDKLRILAAARQEYDRQRHISGVGLDDESLNRLSTLATDFKKLWADPRTPARERKRMLAHIIEDVTLTKLTDAGITRIHVRFKGGRTESLTVKNPLSSPDQVRTPKLIVDAIDELLNDHIYKEIAKILNERGLKPGGTAWLRYADQQFTDKRVQYVVFAYKLRSRFDRLRERGMLTRAEMMERLGVSGCTLNRWTKHGLVIRHAYNGHAYVYEDPGSSPPAKQSSRWNTLVERAARKGGENTISKDDLNRPQEVQYEA